jgi:hypothetical protein
MVGFIDDHRGEHGVEPICDVLPIASSTYYDHRAKRADPSRLSDRARRDEELRPEIRRVFDENWRVYGVRTIWRQLRHEGFDVARCTVARLMKCPLNLLSVLFWGRRIASWISRRSRGDRGGAMPTQSWPSTA